MAEVIKLWRNEASIYFKGINRAPSKIFISDKSNICKILDIYLSLPENKRHLIHTHKNNISKLEYYAKVWIASEKNCVGLSNINSRGAEYHLDHIVPISYGYKIGIPHGLIGHKTNLEIKTSISNMDKSATLTQEAKYLVSKWGYPLFNVDRFGNIKP